MGACDYFRVENLNLQRLIKEIGRGRHAGDLSREDAELLFSAILAGRVPELELGACLIALRVKGESLVELAGFAAACEASYDHLRAPQHTVRGERNTVESNHERARGEPFDKLRPSAAEATSKGEHAEIPVVIPAYNGARALPNLVPLLAQLLARAGIPVLIHGVTRDPGRVTTCEVLGALGITAAASREEAVSQLESRRLAFLPIDVLAPSMARILALRARLGVRNSAHTLAKILQPFSGPALRIVSVTHPEYLTRMREYFTRYDSGALLLRGAEGEAVAHPRREPAIDWAHGGEVETWNSVHASTLAADAADTQHEREELPFKDAESTAGWIHSALDGKARIPAPILHQVECCRRALRALADETSPPRQGGGLGP